MLTTTASKGAVRWIRTGAISAALLVFMSGTAAAQYQSVNWEDPVSDGSGSTGSSPVEEQKEEDERNVATQVSITIGQSYVPVPARGEPATSVSVNVRAVGNKGPLAGARVKLEVVGPASSFVSSPGGFSMQQPVLNGSGAWGTTLYISNPTMPDLGVFPSIVQLRASLSDDEGSLAGPRRPFRSEWC